MRTAIAIAAPLVLAALVGCTTSTNDLARPDAPYRAWSKVSAPVIPPGGLLYTSYHAPLALAPGGFGSKRGTATSYQIGLPPLPSPWATLALARGLDLVAWGDASQKRAAANGGLTQVKHADYRFENFFFFFKRYTTEVYGD